MGRRTNGSTASIQDGPRLCAVSRRKNRSREPPEEPAWHRRSGVMWRPGSLGVPRSPRYGWFWFGGWSNDGGEDVPLSPVWRFRYHLVIGAIIFFGVAAIALAR